MLQGGRLVGTDPDDVEAGLESAQRSAAVADDQMNAGVVELSPREVGGECAVELRQRRIRFDAFDTLDRRMPQDFLDRTAHDRHTAGRRVGEQRNVREGLGAEAVGFRHEQDGLAVRDNDVLSAARKDGPIRERRGRVRDDGVRVKLRTQQPAVKRRRAHGHGERDDAGNQCVGKGSGSARSVRRGRRTPHERGGGEGPDRCDSDKSVTADREDEFHSQRAQQRAETLPDVEGGDGAALVTTMSRTQVAGYGKQRTVQ